MRGLDAVVQGWRRQGPLDLGGFVLIGSEIHGLAEQAIELGETIDDLGG